jgi:hypothetical protein
MSRKPVKPLVFMSHSSRDSEALIALKGLLEDRSAGMIEFFLACDGQSLRFGENWVAGVTDALAKANLMFVFLSEHSVDSHWVWFEAGHASGKDIRVVPVGLPGTEISKVGAPITFRQGFNLHSHGALANLARVCNEVCEAKIKDEFSPADFQKVFATADAQAETVFGRWLPAVRSVEIECETVIPREEKIWNPLPSLVETFCKNSSEKIFAKQHDEVSGTLDTVGLLADIRSYGEQQETVTDGQNASRQVTCRRMHFELKADPCLLHIHAATIDEWYQSKRPDGRFHLKVWFDYDVHGIYERHKLTSRLHLTAIQVGDEMLTLDYKGFLFRLENTGQQRYLWFDYAGNLHGIPFREIIAILFQRGVLFERATRPLGL